MKKKIIVFMLAVCMIVMLFPITALAAYPIAEDIDSLPAPVQDPSLANSLNPSYFGYWEKTFDIGGIARTAKIYIPEDMPIRAYFTVIAVPNNVDTADFIDRAGWKAMADSKKEGLFILEPEPGKNWKNYIKETDYINAAMNYFQGTGNTRFSIFGEHYLVGYGAGAPVLEAWAVANPLRVISQVYLNSRGLPASYLSGYADMISPHSFTFPEGFEEITYSQIVLPTWYINPNVNAADSIAYWKTANDCVETPVIDSMLGEVFNQTTPNNRWMTDYMGPISKVIVRDASMGFYNATYQAAIQNFLYYYTRYENGIAYGNQLTIRADYDDLGIEIYTMYVNGTNREYMVYMPDSAAAIWGDKIPVMWVWAGNSQTDRVFLDATGWWKVAQEEGFMLVIPCEKINSNAISVSHADSLLFYQQLKDWIIANYDVDTTRFYTTGQSAGSAVSQTFGVAMPELFAAVATTSGAPMGWSPSTGTVTMDGVVYPNSNDMIPNFMITGGGEAMGASTLFDSTTNNIDDWAGYFLGVNDLTLSDVDDEAGVLDGPHDRYQTWKWDKEYAGVDVPVFKFAINKYRPHNCQAADHTRLWDFAHHYSMEIDELGNVVRYYSPSGFTAAGDKVIISEASGSNVGAVVDPSFIVTIPTSVNFGTLIKNTGIQTKPFVVTMSDSVLGMGAYVDVNVFSTFLMSAGSATLGYDLFNEAGVQQTNGSTYTSFTADGSDTGMVAVDTAEITQAGAYSGTMLFNFTYVG